MLRLSLALSMVAAATASAQSPIVGLWDFDETSGFTANDMGPNANAGTLINFTNDPAQWMPGVRGNALAFDGVDDYVQIATNGGLPFYDGFGASFSVCVWVNGPPTEDDRILALGSSTSNNPLWTIGTGRTSLGNGDRLQIFARNEAGDNLSRYSDSIVFDGTWHHIAYVETSGRARLYVDGVLDTASMDDRFGNRGTRGPSHGTYMMDLVALGGVLRGATCCHANASLDELRIYGFELNEADVTAVMNGGQPSSCRASFGEYGQGCGGGPLELFAAGLPIVGGLPVTFTMIAGQPNATAFLNIGIGPIAPLDLGAVGLPGCTMYAPTGTMVGAGALSSVGSSPPIPLAIPNISSLACLRVSFQGLTFGTAGVETTNAVIGVLGN